jgi:hypothetical protein
MAEKMTDMRGRGGEGLMMIFSRTRQENIHDFSSCIL